MHTWYIGYCTPNLLKRVPCSRWSGLWVSMVPSIGLGVFGPPKPKAWRIVWSEPLVATPWSHSAWRTRCFYSKLNWPTRFTTKAAAVSSLPKIFTHHSGKTSLKILLYFGKPLVGVGSGGQALKRGRLFFNQDFRGLPLWWKIANSFESCVCFMTMLYYPSRRLLDTSEGMCIWQFEDKSLF